MGNVRIEFYCPADFSEGLNLVLLLQHHLAGEQVSRSRTSFEMKEEGESLYRSILLPVLQMGVPKHVIRFGHTRYLFELRDRLGGFMEHEVTLAD